MNTKIKQAYIVLAATLMLSACVQEDMPYAKEDGGRKIIFHTSLPGVSSRATEIASDIPYFQLTALYGDDADLIVSADSITPYIDNESIDNNPGTNGVTSDKCIWPLPGKDGMLSFFAHYPALDGIARLTNTSHGSGADAVIDYRITDYKVDEDIAKQVDFVTAYTTGSMAENLFKGITLSFGHRMSRIEVKAWGANKSCDIEIAGVRLGGVNVHGNFDFNPAEGADAWTSTEKGIVEYIYRAGDEIVSLSDANSSHNTSAAAISIMGTGLANGNNCAMLIPTADAAGWDFANDRTNTGTAMYISVLLRLTDHEGVQQYPYLDNKQGNNSLNIPVEYFATDAAGKVVSTRLYKKDDAYYTDKDCTEAYTLSGGEEVKEFGWAALPVTADWKAGYIYTYTLDYTYGVGLHDPAVGIASDIPMAGDPIISDKVGITVDVKEWIATDPSGFEVPGS